MRDEGQLNSTQHHRNFTGDQKDISNGFNLEGEWSGIIDWDYYDHYYSTQ